MLFGKNVYINIEEDEIVDSIYLKKLIDGEISEDVQCFELLNKRAILNLTEYLEKNDYVIVPGEYVINQAWGFNDGYILVDNEKREILKFKNKINSMG